jgi:uncharacterized protein (AIM24 family)
MAKLIAIVSRWVIQKLAILIVILAILLIGAWLRMEWTRLTQDKEAIAKKEEILAGLKTAQTALDAEMAPKLTEWAEFRRSKIANAKADLARLDDEILKKGEEWSKKLKEFDSLEKAERAARESFIAAETKRSDLKKKVGWYQERTVWVSKDSRQRLADLKKAEAEAKAKKVAYEGAIKARASLEKVLASSPVKALQDRRRKKEADLEAARGFQTPEEVAWKEDQQRKAQEIDELEELVNSEKERVSRDPRQRFLGAVQKHLPTALWILVGIILTPIAIKAFFYYVLAPLAARFPPIRVVETADASMPEARDSAVSIPFDIAEGSEILVHPDYLQSSSQPAEKRTQWLLNRSVPFSSIASGMFFLTRIRPTDGHPTRVVVSSQNDAFGEIGAIHLPEGASIVVQPRSLAGVVKRADIPVRITRHWRVSSLHAWLTLQLRFLVFHGPCDLILKGCRGVRAEAPDPKRPRMINQASTIGFSANLDYHNTRCETFISYLRGKEDLFNDLFGGEQGVFVYEEMPAGGRKTGLTGRGLEGVVDAALKVFGI